jgi:hypothetical protein
MPQFAKTRLLLLVAIVACTWPSAAHAASITFTGSGTSTTGTSIAAKAVFAVDTATNRLVVTLTNTALSDVMSPADVLTGVFFDVVGNLVFTPATAIVNTGSAVFTGGTQIAGGGSTVGGEWAYAGALSGAPHSSREGISSAGLGLFGNANFSGANLSGPTGVDGVQYGIVSAGDNTSTGNTGVTAQPLIKNSVVFRLLFPSGTSASTFNPALSIFNVNFQYGTSLLEANVIGTPVIPEPASMILMATGLAGLYGSRARKRKQRAALPPTA